MQHEHAHPITRKWPAQFPDWLQLYSLPTPNGIKVSVMLEEAGIPYEAHRVDIHANEQFSPEFLALNPNNKIPAILDPHGPGGQPLALFESGAILIYLAEKSGQLLLGIINDILDMSRIESGKTTLNVEKMNLPQQVSQLDSIIRQQAGQRRQTFTVNTHLQHENVLADPNRLNQVLMNILSNAVKYTPKGGHIRLEVEELPRNEHFARYRFVVQDDGIGMSEEFQKTLFDPFTREEKSGTNKVQGTGLGMAITKSIVDLMGGTIHVESTTGKGTRFEVVLEFPIDAEADTVQEAQVLPEEEETASPLSGMKFLCAEDNAINAEILEMLLEANGASCTICSNGQEIVDAFASVKPGEYDMILMDVQMPVMDGLEATRRIRSGENPLGRIIPILAMTANAFLEDMQKSREAGMDEHLSKPVDIAALEQTVKRFRVIPPKINSGQARFRRGSTQTM
mgnify:CR=1 FL=1